MSYIKIRYDIMKTKFLISKFDTIRNVSNFLTKQTLLERKRETDRDRQRQTETDRDRQRQTETDRNRQGQTETGRQQTCVQCTRQKIRERQTNYIF